MTEEQAKKKLCPLKIAGFFAGKQDYDCNTYCIASDCALWIPERRSKESTMTVVDGGYCGLIKQ